MLVLDPPAPVTPQTEVAPDVDTILERMETVLRERGWCQNKLQNARGNLCLVGVAEVVCKYSEWPWPSGAVWNQIWTRTYDVLPAPRDPCRSELGVAVDWNNAPGRTIDEVCEMLQRARGD